MTKTTLSETLAYECGLTKAESKKIVETVFKLMSDSLITGEDVTITDFASFRIKDRPAKKYKHSTTGEMKVLPAGKRVKVKMSESLMQRVDPDDPDHVENGSRSQAVHGTIDIRKHHHSVYFL